jgi:hypothetical protein
MPNPPEEAEPLDPAAVGLRARMKASAVALAPRLEPIARRIRARFPGAKRERGDVAVMVLGTLLGLTCALFPWYIFYNQDQFGVREFQFSGGSQQSRDTGSIASAPARIGAPFKSTEMPRLDLDVISTGTLSPPPATDGGSIADQPFPADLVEYRLIHVANGRAMIADDTGLWVVQPGSRLPDASRLKSIEQRDGQWVIVTTSDRVIQLAN